MEEYLGVQADEWRNIWVDRLTDGGIFGWTG